MPKPKLMIPADKIDEARAQAAALPARLTVVETVYFEGRVSQQLGTGFAREVPATDADLYERRGKVGNEWKPLDGWNETPTCVVLECLWPPRDVRPTADEDQYERTLGLLVGVQAGAEVVAFAVVRPGETMRLEPTEYARLRVKCTNPLGDARYVLCTVPG